MRGKWAAGIPPRNFTWVIQDQLAMSERPGGFAPHHRRVRRQEEIIWLRVQGFTRIVSMLPSSHNLQAYEKGDVASAHFPIPPSGDARETLSELFMQLEEWLAKGERILVHQEELGDSVVGRRGGLLALVGPPARGTSGDRRRRAALGPTARARRSRARVPGRRSEALGRAQRVELDRRAERETAKPSPGSAE